MNFLRDIASLLWRNRAVLVAAWRFAVQLLASLREHSDGGRFITEAEWNRANAAARAGYVRWAESKGLVPPKAKTAGEILGRHG